MKLNKLPLAALLLAGITLASCGESKEGETAGNADSTATATTPDAEKPAAAPAGELVQVGKSVTQTVYNKDRKITYAIETTVIDMIDGYTNDEFVATYPDADQKLVRLNVEIRIKSKDLPKTISDVYYIRMSEDEELATFDDLKDAYYESPECLQIIDITEENKNEVFKKSLIYSVPKNIDWKTVEFGVTNISEKNDFTWNGIKLK